MFPVTLPVAVHTAAAVAVVYAAGTAAFLLYRTPNPRLGKRGLPVVALATLVVIAVVTGLQLIYPVELSELRRNPSAFSSDQWWRLVTPMFVQSDGWPQIIFNFLGIVLIGPIVQWIYGGRRWLLLFFVPGLIGEFGGYLWDPTGAGSSLPLAGLTGSLFVWLLWPDSGVPRVARLLGAVGLLGGLGLAMLRDIHGPPLLAGACLAALLLWWESHRNRTMYRG